MPVQCPECGERFSSEETLRRHLKARHGEELVLLEHPRKPRTKPKTA